MSKLEDIFYKHTYANYASDDGLIKFEQKDEPVFTLTFESYIDMLEDIAEIQDIPLSLSEDITKEIEIGENLMAVLITTILVIGCYFILTLFKG